jgi:Helix-hairpin-helix domain
MRGRLARCPMCKQGRPKIAEETHDFVSCNGYFDEDAQVRVSCSFQISLAKASRLHPWYTERPTEEQEEAMKAQYEVGTKTSSKGTLGENQNESAIQSAIDKAKAIEWKTSNKTEIMATTSALVKICKECGIDLPKDMETKSVGKLVVANAKSSTAPKVLQMILDEYGFVKDKEAADKLTDDVAAQICQVPENAPLYKMLDEFAELMRKSGEFMKSNMQKKSAQAVAALKFEVTEDNALKLGKPGKSKIPGIGKSTAEKMHEFLTTGTVTKLEELRASIE